MNSNAGAQEKRARRVATRPEPTIYGNCDSWSFIVGKKPRTYSRTKAESRRCGPTTRILFTGYKQFLRSSFGTTCGRSVNRACGSRIVICGPCHMRRIALQARRFYRKRQVADRKVSRHQLTSMLSRAKKIFPTRIFSATGWARISAKPERPVGAFDSGLPQRAGRMTR